MLILKGDLSRLKHSESKYAIIDVFEGSVIFCFWHPTVSGRISWSIRSDLNGDTMRPELFMGLFRLIQLTV